MGLINSILSVALNTALIIGKEKIAENTFHIKLKLNEDSFKNYIAGQQLRILVGIKNITSLGDLVRTYSIWNFNKQKQEIDLAVCTFSNGQGTKWINKVEIGEMIYFGGPKGKLTIDHSAENYLFLGDISALSHLYELSRQLNSFQKSFGIIYAKSEKDFFIDTFSKAKFQMIESLENHTQKVIKEIEKLKLERNKSIVYIAGETIFCKELNSYFRKTLNWETKQIKTKPFWHPNKKGLE